MKKILISLVFLFVTIILTAQRNPTFVSLQVGTSFPVAKYHGKENPEGGFALAGLSTSIEGAWFFKSWLGVGASAGVNMHPVDVGDLGYETVQENPFINDLIIRSDPYLALSLYTGLFFQLPLVPKLSVTAKALGGMIYTRTPYQLYKAEYYLIGDNWYEITSASDYEGSFLAGAGLRYDLNDCLGLSLQSDFTYNVMDFNFILSDGSVRTDEKVVSFVNLSAGLVIKL